MSSDPESPANPLGDRAPTSHERTSGEPWDASYHDGPAPWDIGGPQPAIVRLSSATSYSGTVLDVGCGSGENALFLATLGAAVVGIDVAETALGRGRDSARDRGLDVEFFYADALALERLQRTFETVLDCGLFHTFDAAERARYAASVASVTEPGGTLHVLCFSDEGPDTGPHPVTHDELRATFSDDAGWAIESIGRERLMTRFHGENGVSAWLATMKRR